MFEIADERGGGAVAIGAEFGVALVVVAVRVPGLVVAAGVIDADVAHAGLGETTREQAGAAKRSVAIQLAHLRGLAADIEGIAGGALHAVGGLHGFDLAFQRGVVLALRGVEMIELLNEIDLPPLLRRSEHGVAHVGDEFIHAHVRGDDACGLILSGQE